MKSCFSIRESLKSLIKGPFWFNWYLEIRKKKIYIYIYIAHCSSPPNCKLQKYWGLAMTRISKVYVLALSPVLFLLSTLLWWEGCKWFKLFLLALARLLFELFVGKEQLKGVTEWALSNLDCIMDKNPLYLDPFFFFWKILFQSLLLHWRSG